MKMSKKLVIAICAIFAIAGVAMPYDSLNAESKEEDAVFNKIPFLMPYDTEQVFSEADFAFLERGMSLEEISSIVGQPNGFDEVTKVA